jgi:hypothetical protein
MLVLRSLMLRYGSNGGRTTILIESPETDGQGFMYSMAIPSHFIRHRLEMSGTLLVCEVEYADVQPGAIAQNIRNMPYS